ncbi:hypothetical protein A3J56_01670 [Candidatus Giovannonibacteria bacterium RIFCSPHIGHO2_02_FULL_46_20]|uniref:UDP-glucose/GDP-mannose dehydrogenase dimerisation domain-containing protein n=1 Tax=Candidatus Giovannonibacteria bacterium RIFCSPHIGHO2_02_FULL_46_20 TaxID=1798338 RepID=A0A1F5WE81_9BACT|nr:MAG: hypothetical protein A3J56_01670 [Candidatus Giovannonibacteria bacterium RIFCSPHIGHO2_02_FULL_46_20]
MEKPKNPKIGIVGLGMVGEQMRRYYEEKRGYRRLVNLFCYDVDGRKLYHDNIACADVIFVCVPTPSLRDGSCDTNVVERVISKYADKKPSPVFVIRSTVVPGTCERFAQKYNVLILFNPEFLTEANAWEDFMYPDRQIVGAASGAECHTKSIFFLLPHSERGGDIAMTSTEAEFVKYCSNEFGARKVCFANQTAVRAALYSAVLGAPMDEHKILNAIGLDRRIGQSWMTLDYNHFRGYGGYCFIKDMNAQIEEDLRVLSQIKDATLYVLARAAIQAIKADRDFNRELLRSQKLSEEDVSCHDTDLLERAAKIVSVLFP